MRLCAVLLLAALVLPWAGATRVVRAPHVEVLYDDPALAGYAQEVARAAETELTRVAALFGRQPFPVRVRLQGGDDQFNAFALPLPRPHVTLRPLFPLSGGLGFHSSDPTELVLRHELTHLVQLTDTRVPPGASALPDLGLVGQNTAVLPPAWLLEGIATWVESSGGLGGRLDDARTRALLWTLAADGHVPSLTDVSLASFQAWPGGRARYLLGASFIDRLVREHGFGALVQALHAFQAGHYLLPFDRAWKQAVGTDLDAEWQAWAAGLASRARQAQQRADLRVPPAMAGAGAGGSEDAGASAEVGVPAVSPDGSRLAWRVAGGVRVARLTGAALTGGRTLPLRVVPQALTWSGPHTLVMAAVAPLPGSLPSDLFALDLESGALTRLTRGAHAHLPRADADGCVLYVRDVIGREASLRRLCPARAGDAAQETTVWRAPAGEHVVGLAVSPGGRVALSVYRPGRAAGGVDLALLGAGRLRFLTDDASSELDPAWRGEGELLFASDASGLFELHAMAVPLGATAAAARALASAAGAPAAPGRALTAALGGADQPAPGPAGTVFRTLHGDGYALAWVPLGADAGAPGPESSVAAAGGELPAETGSGTAAAGSEIASATGSATGSETGSAAGSAAPASAPAAAPYPDEPYSPWPSLLPYGWLPTGGRVSLAPAGAGLQLSALSLDDSARHGLELTVGYDTGLRGPLAGGYGWLRYAWNMPELARAPGPPPVVGAAVTVGAWPYGAYLEPVDQVGYGVRVETLVRAPVGAYAGSLALTGALLRAPSLPGWRPEVGVDAVLNGLHGDPFGAVTGGAAFALRGRLSYGASGASTGAWAQAEAYPTVNGVPVVWHLDARAGYRPAPPAPVRLPPWAATLGLGGRVAIPLRLRAGDGLYAVERLDLEPTARVWGGLDGGGGAAIGGGADLGVWADTVLDYEALVRLGVRGGYAGGWWLAFGASIPY